MVQTLTVPVNDSTADIVYSYDMEGLVDGNGDPIPEVGAFPIAGLSGVSYPDGSQSSFSLSHDVEAQLQWLSIDDAGSDRTHRRKFVGLSLESWVDPDDGTVYPQAGRQLRALANGAQELTHTYAELPAAGTGSEVWAVGRTYRYTHSGGYPQKGQFVIESGLYHPAGRPRHPVDL